MLITAEEKIKSNNKIIWEVLISINGYKSWNNLIRKIYGRIELNEKVWVLIKLPSGMPLIFKAKIIEIIPYKKLTWESYILNNKLIKSTHSFEIIEISPYECIFKQTESFEGNLELISHLLKDQILTGFSQMNKNLKNKVEKFIR